MQCLLGLFVFVVDLCDLFLCAILCFAGVFLGGLAGVLRGFERVREAVNFGTQRVLRLFVLAVDLCDLFPELVLGGFGLREILILGFRCFFQGHLFVLQGFKSLGKLHFWIMRDTEDRSVRIGVVQKQMFCVVLGF